MNMLATPIRPAPLTMDEVQDRLSAAHECIGRAGRFSLTMNIVDGEIYAYVTHWFRPETHAFEDCKSVGTGTVADCLAAVERYAAQHAAEQRDAA